jgi:ABC-2 type transport system permease protein
MAVFDQTFSNYAGPITPQWSRFLIVPRYAFRSVFQSRLFTGFYMGCFLPVLVFAIIIYLHHNSEALRLLNIRVSDIVAINNAFFRVFMLIQGGFAALVTLFVASPLVSKDMANNALPLYLCRPFSRAEYVIGKMTVLVTLLSAITWIPAATLFGFQSFLVGSDWLTDNFYVGAGMFIGFWIWIIQLTFVALAASAVLKRKFAINSLLVALYFIPSIMGAIVNELFETQLGGFLSFNALTNAVWSRLLRLEPQPDVPIVAAVLVLTSFVAICFFILTRRVRAYEEA